MKKLLISFFIAALLVSCGEEKKAAKLTIEREYVKMAADLDVPEGHAEKALWLRYPAVSPDGKNIAFSYGGDIFIVNSKGGAARALTSTESYEYMPVWSKDGKSIAFASDRSGNFDIYTMPSAGGESKRITFHSAGDMPFTFTPDGKEVLFVSARMDPAKSRIFPKTSMPELYSASLEGKNPEQLLGIPAMNVQISKDGSRLLYNDKKGYEDKWRKHHKSSITRDIWIYDRKGDSYTKLTDFEGEDRNPVFSYDEKSIFYLSEKSGTFNVWKTSVADPKDNKQITFHKTHPARFLTIAENGMLTYSYDGEIYTVVEGKEPKKLEIFIPSEKPAGKRATVYRSDIDYMDISPDGKQMAFIVHGEVYVSSADSGLTKRVTYTPEEEKSVSFSPDGKKLIYASERKGSWSIYEASMAREEERYFFMATLIDERPVFETEDNTFYPTYSPDGTRVAFLRNRTEVVVYDPKRERAVTVLPAEKSLSYTDWDQWYSWSPDGRWMLVNFNDRDRWSREVGLVKTDGTGEVINLTNSAFEDNLPEFSPDGNMVIFGSRRNGGSDLYGLFLNQDAYDTFRLTKEEFLLLKEKKKEEQKKLKGKKPAEKQNMETVFEKEGLEERLVLLNPEHGGFTMRRFSPDGEKLYTVRNLEKKFDIGVIELRDRKYRVLTSVPKSFKMFWFAPSFTDFRIDRKGLNLYFHSGGRVTQISTVTGKQKPVAINAEFTVDPDSERDYMFNSVWQTMRDKFYKKDLHNVNWKEMKKSYARFLPHINNGHDFAEMLSELLGELNASHTGAGFIEHKPYGDSTGALGIIFDPDYKGEGMKVLEILDNSPVKKAKSKINEGTVITKIDGVKIEKNTNIHSLLNRKVGRYTLVSFRNSLLGKEKEERIKPTSYRAEYNLLYHRWVKRNREETEKLSNGRLGYVHVRGMDPGSFLKVYGDVLGRFSDKDGIVIDTRFNGGGWLHNELAVLFGGKKYSRYNHRGQRNFGGDPGDQWTGKTILLVGESNYSDAHMFPYTYRELKLGKIVGMPVPGTATAVWWKGLVDKRLFFGIPQIGIMDNAGDYLENKQLVPDYVVENQPKEVTAGKDSQLEKAVEVLLKEIDAEKKKSEKK